MAQVIQRALGERVRESGEWRELAADFAELAGLPLSLYGPYGEEWSGVRKGECVAACRRLQECAAGKRHCRTTIQRLLEQSAGGATECVCDAGLLELCVPVRAGGQVIAYLLMGGVRVEGEIEQQLNRARHLMARWDIRLDADEWCGLLLGSGQLGKRRQLAVKRWLERAAQWLGDLAMREGEGENARAKRPKNLPDSIRRAVNWIHGHATDAQSLGEAAAVAGLSEGHFCRLFRHSTGLRYAEYLAEVRLQMACEQLLESRDSIAEIALRCGFQSISQFNRRFRAGIGVAPREYRNRRSGVGSALFGQRFHSGE